MIPEDYVPSRDVMRIVQTIRTKKGRPFVEASREFYRTLDWGEGQKSVLTFFEEFEDEIVRIGRRLDETCSRALGIALVVAAASGETHQ